MRRSFLSIAVLLLIALPSAAQTATDEIEATAFSHDALQLTAAAPAATRTVVIDSAASFSLKVLAPSQTLSVSLVAPNGVTYTVGDPNSAVFESGFFPIDAPATRPGASYLISITTPLAGNWTLNVSESAAISAPLDVLVSTFINNNVRLALVGGGDTFPLGRDVRLALVAFDGSAKISALSVDARLFRPFDPTFAPEGVTFRDDGTGADETAADGIYQAFVRPSVGGNYQVQVDASGMASTGNFRRSAATTLRVVVQNALITGVTDRPIDDNQDGLYDHIGVSASANVVAAGDYLVTIRIKASNGKELQKSTHRSFGVGGGSAEVLFDAEEVTRDLAVNGPYAVVEVRYAQITDGDIVPVDIRYDLGNTAAYLITQLQHPRLRLAGTGTSYGIDVNNNGRFEQINVELDVFFDIAGFYVFSASLTDRNGVEVEFNSNPGMNFNAGLNVVTLAFEGFPIGEHGVDGPYFVSNFILFGEGHSLIATTAFTTEAWLASQFEGFVLVVDTTPPVVNVTATPNVLWPPNHKMVEIAVVVTATDNLDPNPIVELESVTSNQATNDKGDGNTEIDIVVKSGKIFVRAERSGKDKNGRVYTITYKATDSAGNVGHGSATVRVPHSGGK